MSGPAVLEVWRFERPERIQDATDEQVDGRGFDRFVGIMNKYFRTQDDAAAYYNLHNPHMRALNAHGTYVSDWDPATRLFYVARIMHGSIDPIKTVAPFAQHSPGDFDNGENNLRSWYNESKRRTA